MSARRADAIAEARASIRLAARGPGPFAALAERARARAEELRRRARSTPTGSAPSAPGGTTPWLELESFAAQLEDLLSFHPERSGP